MPSTLTALITAWTTLWELRAQHSTHLARVYESMQAEQRITPPHAAAIVVATDQMAAATATYISSIVPLLTQDDTGSWLAALPQRPLGVPIGRDLVGFPYALTLIAHQRWMADQDPWPVWWQVTTSFTMAYAEAGWPDLPTLKEVTPIMFLAFADQPPMPHAHVIATLRHYNLARFVAPLTTLTHATDRVLALIQEATTPKE